MSSSTRSVVIKLPAESWVEVCIALRLQALRLLCTGTTPEHQAEYDKIMKIVSVIHVQRQWENQPNEILTSGRDHNV